MIIFKPPPPFLEPGKWYDPDEALVRLCRALGLLDTRTPTDPEGLGFGDAKWVFWTNNQMANTLSVLLDTLLELKILVQADNGELMLAPGYDPTLFGAYCHRGRP